MFELISKYFINIMQIVFSVTISTTKAHKKNREYIRYTYININILNV